MKKIFLLFILLSISSMAAFSMENILNVGFTYPIINSQQSWNYNRTFLTSKSKVSGNLFALDVEQRFNFKKLSFFVSCEIGEAEVKVKTNNFNESFSGLGIIYFLGLGGKIINSKKTNLILSGVMGIEEYFFDGISDNGNGRKLLFLTEVNFFTGLNLWFNFKLTDFIGLYASVTPAVILGGGSTLKIGGSTLNGLSNFGNFILIPKLGVSFYLY